MIQHLKKTLWLFWGVALLLHGLLLGYGNYRSAASHYAPKRAIAQRFLLTDYCFSTESRHIRHISLPEPIAPFQDLPAYHEHFPSSSFWWLHK